MKEMQTRNEVSDSLARSFKELAQKESIEKITIKQITDKSGVIRPTFYNHFQDKYELLEWIIEQEILGPVKPLVLNGFISEGLVLIFTNLAKEKEFYMKASRLEGQNSFESIVRDCIYNVLLEFLNSHEVTKKPEKIWLTPERLARYYAQSMTFAVVDWIQSGMYVQAREMAEIYNYIISRSMDDILNEMY